MCSKNIFFILGFWVGLPQNLSFDFSVQEDEVFAGGRLVVGTTVRGQITLKGWCTNFISCSPW